MKKANIIVMTITGITLLVAAVLKIHQLLTEPIISDSFWESWIFFVIQIPLEIGLAIWLLCGLFRKAAWLLALLAFVGFIGVTVYKWIIGAESCGCFGTVKVDPRITLMVMDVPVFLALAIFRPKGEKLLPPPWPSAKHFFSIAIPTFIILPAIVAVLVFNKPPLQTETYEVVKPQEWVKPKPEPVIVEPPIVESPNVVVVEANDPEPIKNEWSELEQIDIADELRTGAWVVLFYHFDCPDCKEAIPIYEETYRSMEGNNEAIRFAFVEMPPYGDDTQQLVSEDTLCLKGRLLKKWFVTSPLVVVLFDGEVMATWEGTAPGLDELLEAAFSETE